MKRLILYSLAAVALYSISSAHAKPFELTQQEITALNESATEPPASPPSSVCDTLKPKDNSSDVRFNAQPCFGRPRKISANAPTREAAKYACGKHAGQWEAFCACSGKKLNYRPDFLGDISFVDCGKNPNSKVDCGIFACE